MTHVHGSAFLLDFTLENQGQLLKHNDDNFLCDCLLQNPESCVLTMSSWSR